MNSAFQGGKKKKKKKKNTGILWSVIECGNLAKVCWTGGGCMGGRTLAGVIVNGVARGEGVGGWVRVR